MAKAKKAIQDAADEHRIPVMVLEGIVRTESGGNPLAMRVEPDYKWLWDVQRNAPARDVTGRDFPSPDYVSRQTEYWGQKTSWGLMQIMGATAREMGFEEPFFSALCANPAKGMYYGCLFLRRLADRYLEKHGWPGVVAAYNAGAPRYDERGKFMNQGYVDKVMRG